MPAGHERVVPFPEARQVVERHAAGLLARARQAKPQRSDLLAADRRVLAEVIVADRDLPPFRRATRDGYAVRAADAAAASENNPATLELVGEIAAGAATLPTVRAGQAAAIMTGAPVPPGADAVIMVEYSRASSRNNCVELLRGAQVEENIVPRGAEARAGSTLLAPGCRLNAAAIGLAASVGRSSVQVFPRPRVAILATGDELVALTRSPAPHQIRNSNSYSLAAQVEISGGDAIILPIAPDHRARLRRLIATGLAADLLLLSGGVSMGKHDLVEATLAEFGAEFFFTGALMQPGKPVVFGRAWKRTAARARQAAADDGDDDAAAKKAGNAPRLSRAQGRARSRAAKRQMPAASGFSESSRNARGQPTYFFGLPGNPVSTLTTFDVLARPLLEALAGATPQPLCYLRARLKEEIRVKPGLTRFLPGLLTAAAEAQTETEVARIPWQGSGDLVSAARANCYVVIPPETPCLPAGEMAMVLLLSG